MSNDTSFSPGITRSIAYSGTAGTTIIPAAGSEMCIYTTTDAFVSIGPSPTATATYSMPVTGKVPQYFRCNKGDLVSFIQQTASGTGYVTDMSAS